MIGLSNVLERVYYIEQEMSSVLAWEAGSSHPVPRTRNAFHPPLERRGLSGDLRCKYGLAATWTPDQMIGVVQDHVPMVERRGLQA